MPLGIFFPGIISLAIMATVLLSAQMHYLGAHVFTLAGWSYWPPVSRAEVLFAYVWLAASMDIAYLAKVVDGTAASAST